MLSGNAATAKAFQPPTMAVWDGSRTKALLYQSYTAQLKDILTSQDFSSLFSKSQTGSIVRVAAQAKEELHSRGPFADWAKKEIKMSGPKLWDLPFS